jgi:hypothetical protein
LGRRDRTGEIVIPPSGYAMMRGISVFKSGNDLELAFEWDKQKAKVWEHLTFAISRNT